ncbi:VanZ family protein [Methylomonas paludis]|uniref:VanZ family protein n=1 Tax=Methylomonas paludis TaxID=1173101 RepID=A0A975MNT4_9GAMM|nr:VanZ family protein [Methylomonas paludis]QWF71185.1 VanZ family protein [Methylomonas paludis]
MLNYISTPVSRSIVLVVVIVAWIGLLFTESSHPSAEIFDKIEGLDKVAHFFAFGVLSLLASAASLLLSSKPSLSIFSAPLLIVSVVGALEEWYQMYVPTRNASFADLMADVLGAIFAILLANWLARLNRTHQHFPTNKA